MSFVVAHWSLVLVSGLLPSHEETTEVVTTNEER